jgi:signal transduction histidine kinase/ActR/RegA family two-component response regulator
MLRSEAENQLRDLNSYYRRTLEGQQGMILCFREEAGDFVHTLCRGLLARRLGWTAERVEGKRLDDFLPPEMAARLRAAYQRAWNGEECTVEGESPDGKISFLALLQPRGGGEGATEAILSAVEITDRKRVELELRAAKERAESADRTKSEFLAVMSHEIRTPLNAILGFTDLLLENCREPSQHLWIKTIDQSGRVLSSLINDILDFSKIEAGQLELRAEPMEVADVMQSAVGLFRPAANEKGVALELRMDPALPAVIMADPLRIRQIITNLLANAVKFTKEGTISVGVVLGPGSGGEGRRPELAFLIKDTGIGIAEDVRGKLFKPFSQADSSTSRQYGGTGLGLAISRRLARAMGGELDYVSEAGRGSLFTFTLPAVVTPVAESPAAAITSANFPGLARLRVLVAEDNPSNRLLITALLRKVGIVPVVVNDGQAAVDAVAAAPYDLILMDVQMPGVDGLTATRAIRAAHPEAPMRIIAVTAGILPEQKMDCLESGMDSVLGKPILFAQVLRELILVAGQIESAAAVSI